MPTSTRSIAQAAADNDSAAMVQQKNKAMHQAWREGQKLVEKFGTRSPYGAMQRAAKGNVSAAEKMRQLRRLAAIISEKEVEEICSRCEQAGRAWGPSYLIALSRLPTKRQRQTLVGKALQARWSSADLKQHVRMMLGPQKDATKVGRRRQIDYANEQAILVEISRQCVSWLRLVDGLKVAAELDGTGLKVLTPTVRKRVLEMVQQLAELQASVTKRSNTLRVSGSSKSE